MKMYTMEVLRVTNTTTSKRTYYKRVCDVMQRISYADYEKHDAECDGKGSMITQCKGDKVRQWTTLIFYVK